jgi:hypothetical protein
MERMLQQLTSLDDHMEKHDQVTNMAIARMEERTKPLPKRGT